MVTGTVINVPPRRGEDTLPDKCCGRCTHARPVKDAVQLKTLFECKEGPPTPIMMQVTGGVVVKSYFPILSAESECDRFQARVSVSN